ncbi:TPA: hypothetical protein ACRR1C_004409, partial [Klebsiella quasipneumoniae]
KVNGEEPGSPFNVITSISHHRISWNSVFMMWFNTLEGEIRYAKKNAQKMESGVQLQILFSACPRIAAQAPYPGYGVVVAINTAHRR